MKGNHLRRNAALLLLLLFLLVVFWSFDGLARRMAYDVVDAPNGTVFVILPYQEFLICWGAMKICILDMSTHEVVWCETSPDRPNRFLQIEGHDGVFLVGDGLRYLHRTVDGWKLESAFTKEDLIRIGVPILETRFQGHPCDSLHGMIDDVYAIGASGGYILGRCGTSGDGFEPMYTYGTRDFILLRDDRQGDWGQHYPYDYYLYKKDEIHPGLLELSYCDMWRSTILWPGSGNDNLVLREGIGKKLSALGKVDVGTIELVLIEDCGETRTTKTFGGHSTLWHGAVSPDTKILFAVGNFDTPLEFDIDSGSQITHRRIVGPRRHLVKGLGVTCTHIDWDTGKFYLGTSFGKIFIGSINSVQY